MEILRGTCCETLEEPQGRPPLLTKYGILEQQGGFDAVGKLEGK
jgi:hypothetical protein